LLVETFVPPYLSKPSQKINAIVSTPALSRVQSRIIFTPLRAYLKPMSTFSDHVANVVTIGP